jgi:hypothetical protein
MSIRDFSPRTRWLGTAAVAILTSILLAGCGGVTSGGVGTVKYALPSVPTTTVPINGTNAQSVAQDTLGASAGSVSSGAGGVSAFSAGGSGKKLHRYLDGAMNIANKMLVARLTGADGARGFTITSNCSSSGSITLTTSGDDYKFKFNSCDNGLVVIDGAIAATNVSYTGSPPTAPFSVSIHYSYNLTFAYSGGANLTEVGSFDIDFGDDNTGAGLVSYISNGEMGITNNVTGKSIAVTNFTRTRTCDSYTSSPWACIGTFTQFGSYTVSGDVCGGSVNVVVPSGNPITVNMAGGAQYPYSGEIDVTGSGGSSLTITIFNDDIDSGNASLGYDLTVAWDNGAGSSGSANFSWGSV